MKGKQVESSLYIGEEGAKDEILTTIAYSSRNAEVLTSSIQSDWVLDSDTTF